MPLTIACCYDPVKFHNKRYPEYPKPCVAERLGSTTDLKLVTISPADILGGCLRREKFDVLLIPGGFAPHWTDALGEVGERTIREFVASGGGYVGLCAGAYFGVWAKLLPAEIIDIDHWQRGSTDRCELRWTDNGMERLGLTGRSAQVRYNNGPLLRSTGPAAASLAEFVTDLRGKKGTYKVMMAGTTAVLHGRCGKGSVVLVSPHIESSADSPTAKIFCDLFRLAATGVRTGSSPTVSEPTSGRQLPAAPPLLPSAALARPPQLIFVYGSLRPDDDSGMPWTKAFSRNLTARRASLAPAMLFEDEYASLVLCGTPRADGPASSQAARDAASASPQPRVVGYVIGCDDAASFARKLKEADRIEGYEPRGGGLYERAVVSATIEGSGDSVLAYVYHRPYCNRAVRIWSGDWLQRRAAREAPRDATRKDVTRNEDEEEETDGEDDDDEETESEEEEEDDDEDEEKGEAEQPTGTAQSAAAAPAVALPLPKSTDQQWLEARRLEAKVPATASTLEGKPYSPVKLVLPTRPAAAASRPGSRAASRLTSAAASTAASTTFASTTRSRLASATATATASSLGKQRLSASCQAAPDGYSSSAPYVCQLGAPLLFTAPHGLKLRKGIGHEQSARSHARERYTSEIVLMLAARFAQRQQARTSKATAAAAEAPALAHAAAASSSSASMAPAEQPAAFMVWNYKTAAIDDPRNMDPNFLKRSTLRHSPWHSCLHAWKASNGCAPGQPCPQLLHVDVHGKCDREDSMAIDVGMLPLEEEGCLSSSAVDQLRARLTERLQHALKGKAAVSAKSKRRMPITVQPDPVLHGYWGNDTVMTMSHQSALLGATSLQFELPTAVRQLLMVDQAAFEGFADAIFDTYDALAAHAPAPVRGWTDSDEGQYLAAMGSAKQPLHELAVSSLGTEQLGDMLRDLQRADQGGVHGKSI